MLKTAKCYVKSVIEENLANKIKKLTTKCSQLFIIYILFKSLKLGIIIAEMPFRQK